MGRSPQQILSFDLDDLSSSVVKDSLGNSAVLERLVDEGVISESIDADNLSQVLEKTTARVYDNSTDQVVTVTGRDHVDTIIESYKIKERVPEAVYKKSLGTLTETERNTSVTMTNNIQTTFAGGTTGKSQSSISDTAGNSSDINTVVAEVDVELIEENRLLSMEVGSVNTESIYVPLYWPDMGVDFGYFSLTNASADLIGVYGSESFTLGQYSGTNATNFNSKMQQLSRQVLGSWEQIQCVVMMQSKDQDLGRIDGLNMFKLTAQVASTPVVGNESISIRKDWGVKIEASVEWDPAIEGSVSIINGVVNIITAPFKLIGRLLRGISF